MCQGCVDEGRIAGWLAEIIEAHEDIYDDGYEGAHIVIGDWNVSDSNIAFCLSWDGYMQPETRRFLWWLLTIPENERAPNPDAGLLEDQ